MLPAPATMAVPRQMPHCSEQPKKQRLYIRVLLVSFKNSTLKISRAGTWGMMRSEESGMPGSAGTLSITVADSTAMMPTGVPPSLARPAGFQGHSSRWFEHGGWVSMHRAQQLAVYSSNEGRTVKPMR